jgi:WD40 repeat protein
VQVWDLTTGQSKILSIGYRAPNGVAMVDQLLAAPCSDKRIYLWDTDSGHVVRVLEGHGDAVDNVAFHPVGTLLASWGLDGVSRLWDVPTGKEVLSLPGYRVAKFSAGAHLVLATGLQMGLWEVATGLESRRLASLQSSNIVSLGAATFSPDGRLLATRNNSAVRLWDTVTWEERASLNLTEVSTLAFHPVNGSIIIGRGQSLVLLPVEKATANEISFGTPQTLPFSRSTDLRQVLCSCGRTNINDQLRGFEPPGC